MLRPKYGRQRPPTIKPGACKPDLEAAVEVAGCCKGTALQRIGYVVATQFALDETPFA
jgi:hypothetical protein